MDRFQRPLGCVVVYLLGADLLVAPSANLASPPSAPSVAHSTLSAAAREWFAKPALSCPACGDTPTGAATFCRYCGARLVKT